MTAVTRCRRTLLGAVLVLGLTASIAGAQAIRLPPSRTIELKNGLRVILAEQHAVPMVEARLWIPAGLVSEPDGREGLTNFTARLLTQGTEKRSAVEIAREVDQMGASLDAEAARDQLRVSLTSLARHRKRALELLAECVINSTFPDSEVERIRSRLLADLEQTAEDAGALAEIALWQVRFDGDPYGRRLQGTHSSLKAITASEIRDYHRKQLVPTGAVLTLVGDFNTKQVEKEVRKLFGGWKGKPAVAPPPASMPAKVRVVLINKPELTQTQIRLGFPGLRIGDPEEPALITAATIVGGGFTSRLMEAIRVQRSLSYSVNCRVVQGGRTGLLRVSTFTKAPTTRETVDVALEELKRFREEGPTAEELQRSINFLSGSVARSLQAPGDVANSLTNAAFYHLPEDYVVRRIERIRAVTVQDCRRITETYFAPTNMVMVLVGDSTAVRSGLDGLGSIEEKGFESLLQ